MLKLILQRLLQMALIMAVVSLILFLVFDSPKFKKQLAVNELGGFAVATLTESDYQNWLAAKGRRLFFRLPRKRLSDCDVAQKPSQC